MKYISIWGKPERAPHKLVVTVCCMSVMCPKFYGDNTESPTLVVVAYVVRTSVGHARKFTAPKWKAPHVKKHVVNMASNVASNSDLKGELRVLEKVCACTIAVHGVVHCTNDATAWD